jgi:hypothetical protein
MNRILLALPFLLAVLLPGCAHNPTIEPPKVIQASDPPVSKSGYVAATVMATSKQSPGPIALGLVNTMTYAEHLLPIGNLSYFESYRDLNNVPRIVAIPPGQYRVAYWITYFSDTNEVRTKQTIPTDSPMSVTFSVAPDGLTFLGSFTALSYQTHAGTTDTTHWSVTQNPISELDARNVIKDQYPNFSKRDFFCPRCTIGSARGK